MTSFGAGRVGEADEERDDGLDTIVAKTRRTLNASLELEETLAEGRG